MAGILVEDLDCLVNFNNFACLEVFKVFSPLFSLALGGLQLLSELSDLVLSDSLECTNNLLDPSYLFCQSFVRSSSVLD